MNGGLEIIDIQDPMAGLTLLFFFLKIKLRNPTSSSEIWFI